VDKGSGVTQASDGWQPSVVVTYTDGDIGIECGFCAGSGAFPESVYDDEPSVTPCSVCNGIGFNVHPRGSEGWMVCRLCGGDGKAADEDGYFAGDTCSTCAGRGFIDISAVRRDEAAKDDSEAWSLLHPSVCEVAKPRFDAGLYADSVEAAFKHVNAEVKRAVSNADCGNLDGARLMERVFSPGSPLLVLDDLTKQSGRDVQLGYMKMFAGAMTGVRNPKAHDNVLIDANRALHLLFVASLFLYKLEDAREHGHLADAST